MTIRSQRERASVRQQEVPREHTERLDTLTVAVDNQIRQPSVANGSHLTDARQHEPALEKRRRTSCTTTIPVRSAHRFGARDGAVNSTSPQ